MPGATATSGPRATKLKLVDACTKNCTFTGAAPLCPISNCSELSPVRSSPPLPAVAVSLMRLPPSVTANVEPAAPVSVKFNSPAVLLSNVAVLVPKFFAHCCTFPVPFQVYNTPGDWAEAIDATHRTSVAEKKTRHCRDIIRTLRLRKSLAELFYVSKTRTRRRINTLSAEMKAPMYSPNRHLLLETFEFVQNLHHVRSAAERTRPMRCEVKKTQQRLHRHNEPNKESRLLSRKPICRLRIVML